MKRKRDDSIPPSKQGSLEVNRKKRNSHAEAANGKSEAIVTPLPSHSPISTPSWLTRVRKISTSRWSNVGIAKGSRHRVQISKKTKIATSLREYPRLDQKHFWEQSNEESSYESDQDYDYLDPLVMTNQDAQYQISIGLIDPDRLTYEQLLELEEKIGHVNPVFSTEQIDGHSVKEKVDKSSLSKLQKSGEEICQICLDNYSAGSWIRKLKCGHIFHAEGFPGYVKRCLQREGYAYRLSFTRKRLPIQLSSASTVLVSGLRTKRVRALRLTNGGTR
jgi:hypothetical protein